MTQKAITLHLPDMVLNGIGGAETYAGPDLFIGGRISVAGQVRLYEVENALPSGAAGLSGLAFINTLQFGYLLCPSAV